MTLDEIKKFCDLSPEARNTLKEAVESMHISNRGYLKLIKISRTIADLELSPNVKSSHVAEALQYRKEEFFNKRLVTS